MEKFGLIGEKLGHSYSPLIHGKFADYEYDLIEVAEENLEKVIKSSEYGGFNVTIPYKKTVLKYCDELSEQAKSIGSVNTIVKDSEGKIRGYNTDYYGFLFTLQENDIDVKGKKCLVLGSGGASVTVQAVLRDNGAEEVLVVSRKGEINYDNISEHNDAEIIVNTTPVGMYPENGNTPVDISMFPKCEGLVDLIYNPNQTKLVMDAKERGIKATGGLKMLVAQAKQASELFVGEAIELQQVHDAIREIEQETLNMVLIGMPGAGKTTIGREIANSKGRKFVDIDEMIVEREGMSIPEIFKEKGEAYFRQVESEVLDDACKEKGIVIATGGGIVKKKHNYKIMRQNGIIVWIKRDLDKLETAGRPVSQSTPLEQLYEERKDAYSEWSDYFINNNEERE